MRFIVLAVLALTAVLFAGCGPSAQSSPAKDNASAESPAETTAVITIRANVPDDTPTVYLVGNLPELGPWDPGAFSMEGEGRERTAVLNAPAGHVLQYKFTLGSWEREALGPSGTIMPNFTLTVEDGAAVSHDLSGFGADPEAFINDPEGAAVEGRLVYWKDVSSKHLSETRHVVTWLPPGYDNNPEKRYRVIYMSDGQNIFDPRLAYTGVDWGVDEAVMRGVRNELYDPVIIVGVWNTVRRVPEYSPWHDGPDYGRFVVEELMPRVNEEFRTLTGPENTFHMGSSMGGLISFYLVNAYPDVFGACGCVSTHFTLSEAMLAGFLGGDQTNADETPYILRDIENGAGIPEGVRYYFDYGTKGLDAFYEPPHLAVAQWLREQGLEEGEDFVMRKYEGADHNEASWRARADDPLRFLLAPKAD
ncbi:MAG: alpha/beta hydrolase-fold protein [Pseudomonadota bacterium]